MGVSVRKSRPQNAAPIGNAARSGGVGNSSIRGILGMLSPAGTRGRLTILIFHRVHAKPHDLFPKEMHAAAFRERMTWVRTWFNVLALDEAVSGLARGSLPARALAITFDDGYADNYTVAWPILRELGLHATFFVAAGFLDGGRMWNDTLAETIRRVDVPSLDLSALDLGRHRLDSLDARREAFHAILQQIRYLPQQQREDQANAVARVAAVTLPRDQMMTTHQVRSLAAAGMGIGGHTLNHPTLARLDDVEARREIAEGRDALEVLTRQAVKLFAYPNGKPGSDYTLAHVKIARELGFMAAFTTSRGTARFGDPLHELPRFTPWDRTAGRWVARLARNLLTHPERAAG
jgi:peptidoglycan/xylan/chitin deacetylase (PgdA/CDA1 family)